MERIQEKINKIDSKLDYYFSKSQKLGGMILLSILFLICLSFVEYSILQIVLMFFDISLLVGFLINFWIAFRKFRYNSQNKRIAMFLKQNFINESFK